MYSQRVMIMVLACLVAISTTCATKAKEVTAIEFEGGLVLEVTIPAQASVKVIDASDRVPTVNLDRMVVIGHPDWEAVLTVEVRPSAWTDEILLDYIKKGIGDSTLHDDGGMTVTEKASEPTSFSSDSSRGYYQTLKLTNAYSDKELSAVMGGHAVENLWIYLMLSVPVTDSPPIEDFTTFADRISVAHSVNDDFLQPDDFVPRRLKALQMR